MRVARVTSAAFVVLASAALVAQSQSQNQATTTKKLDDAQKREVQALLAAIDNAVKGQPEPTGVAGKWEQHHFIKAQGNRTYIPFTVSIEPASIANPSVAVYLRVVDKKPPATPTTGKEDKNRDRKDRIEYAFEDINFADLRQPEPGETMIRLTRAFSVPAGDYDVIVGVKERPAGTDKKAITAAQAEIGIIRHTLTVPDFWANELTTSSVILAAKAEPLAAALTQEQQAEQPYAIGGARLTPSLDMKFKKAGELNVVFWIYNSGVDAAGKPDVTIEYNFHQKAAEAEKFFNKTNPQTLNAQSLPPQFNIAAGHQLPGSLTIPLKTFPEGEFRLEVKIIDNITKKAITRDLRFTVTA